MHRILLFIGRLFNVSFLGYYKYFNFIVSNINSSLSLDIVNVSILLPLAISFFTFQQISYLVDNYQGKVENRSFLNYMLFVVFSPQLIAGPIIHHKETISQFSDPEAKIKCRHNIALGIFIFSIGLFKKVVIADSLSVIVDDGFLNSTSLDLMNAWMVSLSYTFQLYYDFSGYCDMAIGIALLFNIKLPINFNSPYKALNIQEFWKGWHMSLGRFLKNYVYIPIGGSKKGLNRTCVNLLATFLIGGIWHGASWTFVIWGLVHGFALVIHRLFSTIFDVRFPRTVSWLITFVFINCSWVIFRAPDIDVALNIIRSMFDIGTVSKEMLYGLIGEIEIAVSLIILLLAIFMKNTREIAADFKYNTYYGFILSICSILGLCFMMFAGVQTKFLYFNF